MTLLFYEKEEQLLVRSAIGKQSLTLMNRNKLNQGSGYRTAVGLASQSLEILQDSNPDSVKTL